MLWQLHQVDKNSDKHIPFLQYEHTGAKDSSNEMFGVVENTIHQFPLPDGMRWEILNEDNPHFIGIIENRSGG